MLHVYGCETWSPIKLNPAVRILIRKDWKHGWNKKQQVKLKQVWYVLQFRGKEWLEICIENRNAKPVLLQVFGNLSSFWIICSYATLCIENIYSFPGRVSIMFIISSFLLMRGYNQGSQPVLTFRWKILLLGSLWSTWCLFMNSSLSSLALYPKDIAQRFSAGGDFKKRILNFCHEWCWCIFLYNRAGGWMTLYIPLHSKPFHLYFSLVPQDKLADIILY